MPPEPDNIDEQLLHPDLDEDAVPLQRYASLTGRGGGWFSQTQARASQLLLAQLHKGAWAAGTCSGHIVSIEADVANPLHSTGALRRKWMAVPPLALLLSSKPAKSQSELPAKQTPRLQLPTGTDRAQAGSQDLSSPFDCIRPRGGCNAAEWCWGFHKQSR